MLVPLSTRGNAEHIGHNLFEEKATNTLCEGVHTKVYSRNVEALHGPIAQYKGGAELQEQYVCFRWGLRALAGTVTASQGPMPR